MWNSKQQQNDTNQPSATPGQAPQVTPISVTAPVRPSSPSARTLSFVGSSLEIKGRISGEEDLQIDGKVEGPIALQGQKLIAGRSAQIHSEVVAREVIVYGKVNGNLRAQDRVEIKKDGSVIGDITTARIMIEDGAYFKGRIEIDRTKAPVAEDLESLTAPVAVAVT
jgi:cytoskeletal protein CcmA (bactofilin family)